MASKIFKRKGGNSIQIDVFLERNGYGINVWKCDASVKTPIEIIRNPFEYTKLVTEAEVLEVAELAWQEMKPNKDNLYFE